MPRLLLIGAVVSYLAAFALCGRHRAWALTAAAVGLLPHALAIALRWHELGHGPYQGLFDSLSSNLWIQLALFLAFAACNSKIRAASVMALGLSSLFALWLLLIPPQPVALPPTYNTWWLYVHLYAGKLAYGLLFVAASLALTDLRGRSGETTAFILGHDPMRRLMLAAFICHTWLLFAGGNWAYLAWGKYWDWNVLEIWTLLTWLGFGLYFHRHYVSMRWLPSSQWLALMVYASAILTFYGIPFLSKATHQGLI